MMHFKSLLTRPISRFGAFGTNSFIQLGPTTHTCSKITWCQNPTQPINNYTTLFEITRKPWPLLSATCDTWIQSGSLAHCHHTPEPIQWRISKKYSIRLPFQKTRIIARWMLTKLWGEFQEYFPIYLDHQKRSWTYSHIGLNTLGTGWLRLLSL